MRSVGAEHADLSTEVFDELRELIVLGTLIPGQRLVETTLAERLGVSRGTVRSALAELARVGLVELTSRRGARVITLTPADVADIYAVRGSLEQLSLETAEPASVRATLPALRSDLDELEQALDKGELATATKQDLQFHRHLVSMADNGRLRSAWDNLAEQVRLVIGWLQRCDPTVAARSGEHRGILAALECGDVEGACAALAQHLAQSEDVVRAATAAWPPSCAARAPAEGEA